MKSLACLKCRCNKLHLPVPTLNDATGKIEIKYVCIKCDTIHKTTKKIFGDK